VALEEVGLEKNDESEVDRSGAARQRRDQDSICTFKSSRALTALNTPADGHRDHFSL
jgi:hypothetical protein